MKKDLTGVPLNIVHRDVSPQNIIVTYDGGVKVVDFGIAKASNRIQPHTKTGIMKGKLAYMAPEQAATKRDLTAAADVFSLGVMLYEMLTRSRLYAGMSELQVITRLNSKDPYPSVLERSPQLDTALAAITSKAMAIDPAERYANGRELHIALEEWLSTQARTPTVVELEALMQQIFAERLQQRRKQLEELMAGRHSNLPVAPQLDSKPSMPGMTPEPSPSSRSGTPVPPLEMKTGTLPLRPLGTPQPTASAPRLSTGAKRLPNESAAPESSDSAESSRFLLAVIGLLVLVILGGVAMFMMRTAAPEPAPVVAPKPVPVATPVPPTPVAVIDAGAAVSGDTGVSSDTAAAQNLAASDLVDAGNSVPSLDVEVGDVTLDKPKKETSKRGFLSLATEPWTRVFLGKTELGDTPLLKQPLPAGTHTLRLVNEEQHIDRRIEVEIESGKTTSLKLSL